MTLDEAIRIEGALDFIQRGFTKSQHVLCFKLKYQAEETVAFEAAEKLVQTYGTVRKALNYIKKEINRPF